MKKRTSQPILCGPVVSMAVALFLFCLSNAPVSAQVKAWGRNDIGQLGLGGTGDQPTPVTIGNSGDITAISGGVRHSLFLRAEGTLLATGNNQYGQLGDGTSAIARLSPVPVVGVSNVVAVSGGALHSLALLANGTVMSWGRFAEGQLGGSNCSGPFIADGCSIPGTIPGFSNVVAIEAGAIHSLALKADGTVWAWGNNTSGQLGIGALGSQSTPRQVGVGVPGFSSIIAIAAGVEHSVALKSDGTVWIWGSNTYGEVGNGFAGSPQLLPVQNVHITGVSRISAGFNLSVALKPNGTVWSWGFNNRGNIGNGTSGNGGAAMVHTPTQAFIADVIDVRTAEVHTIAKKRDGTIWSWGWNQFGQMGNGTVYPFIPGTCQCQPTPVLSAVGAGNAVIGIGYDHSFVATPSVTTSTGSNVTLHGDGLNITFDSVTAAGNTTISAIDPVSTGLNTGSFSIASNSAAYDFGTTAAFAGNIKVCLQVSTEFDQTTFNSLAVLHGEGPNLVDRTISRNYANREICAQTTSLSPFVVAQASASPGQLQFAVSVDSISESAGTATVTVTRTDGSAGPVSVAYMTSDGSASGGANCAAGVDYVASSNTLTWADGDGTNKTFTIFVCDDTADENNETINLTLSSPTGGAVLGAQSTETLTITDDDASPPICATDVGTQVNVVRGGFRFNYTSGRYVQSVRLTNTGGSAIQGPVSLVLDNLSGGVTLFDQSGTTSCALPSGSYITINLGNDDLFTPGETVILVLQFENPSNQAISYGTRVLSGANR